MPFYGDNSDLKQAGKNIVAAETILPVLLIFINVAFLSICVFVFHYSIPDIFNITHDDHLMVLSSVILTYALTDFLLGCFLFLGVTKLSPILCRIWIFLQIFFLGSLLSIIFALPFFVASLEYIFWELVCCCILLGVYKFYRIFIIHFLIKEIKEEGAIWKQQSIYE